MGKVTKKSIAILLTVGLVIALVPNLGKMKKVDAAVIYNPAQAVDYARKYSCNHRADSHNIIVNDGSNNGGCCRCKYNPQYAWYAGNDCANFVSQCLVAGGLPVDNTWGVYEQNGVIKGTSAWNGTYSMIDYFKNNPNYKNLVILNPSYSDLKAGNPVWTTEGHVVLCTEDGSKCCAHTNSWNDGKLWTSGVYTVRLDLLSKPMAEHPGSVLDFGQSFTSTINDVNGQSLRRMDDGSIKMGDYSYSDRNNYMWKFDRQSDGTYSISSIKDGMVIDVKDAGTTNSTPAQMYGWNASSAQRYYICDIGGGYYALEPVCAPGSILDRGGLTGEILHLWKYEQGNNNQKFIFGMGNALNMGSSFDATIEWTKNGKCLHQEEDDNLYIRNYDENDLNRFMWHFERYSDGSYKISSWNNNKCIDVSEGKNANQTNILTYSDNGSKAQKWDIFDVGNGNIVLEPRCAPARTLDVGDSSGNVHLWTYDENNINQVLKINKYNGEGLVNVKGVLNEHEYIVCKDSLTATEARVKEGDGYHLATITSEAEYNFIMNLSKKISKKPAGYWLGANDNEQEGVFRWETGEPFIYHPWPDGQPDNNGGELGNENYFGLWSSGIWNDFPESYKLGYVLEKDPPISTASGIYQDHEYFVSAGYLNRADAERLQENGWYLATITSSGEKDYVISLINGLSEKNMQGYWLGADDATTEGVFTWSNGEHFSYENWDSGEPSNSDGHGRDEDYLALRMNGKFNDLNENEYAGYILECDPDSRIIRVNSIALTSDRDETKDVYENDSFRLFATVLPEDATDKTITWTSSDTGYATVDSIGKVTVKDTIPNVIKNITINASSSDGEVTSSYTFTVCPRSSCSHTWNTGTTIKEPTCSEVGEKEYSCTKCGTTKIEPVEQKAHTIVIDDAVPEKCELDGKTEGSHCSVCGKVIVEQKIIPASGHNYGDYISDNNETCTTDATATAKCTKCGRENSIIVEGTATGVHIWTEYEVIKPATCTDIGVKQRECVYCGKKETLGIAKLSHEYEEEVQQKATCTEEGIKRLKCKNCGNEKYESIDMIDHVLVDIPAIPSNCTKAGMTAGKKCSECGKVVVAPKATALAAHKVVIDPAVEATTTSTGLTSGSHCSECGVIIEEQKVIPKKVETNGSEQSVSDGKASEGSGTSGSNSSNNSNASNSNNKETSGTTPQKPTNKLEKTSDGTKYYKEDGSAAKSEWVLIDGKKYYFNDDGYAASNEWRDGKWINNDGSCTYTGTLSWKGNSTGWWVEDTAGWYPQDSWQKIDGVWYYFKLDGYMASGEYYNGYWFNKDGSWDDKYLLSWKSNSTGWWVEDISGWWPSNSWLKIDGEWYYFDASGYMVTNQYVDGYWIGSDGVCR